MNNIAEASIDIFENNLKNNNAREVLNHWVKIKERIGVNNIEFIFAENLFSQDNKITVITKNSVIIIKTAYKEEPPRRLTTPIYVTESKKKIKEKNYEYTNGRDWGITFVYDDDSKLIFSKNSLEGTYYSDEINEAMFLYLINL